MSQENISAWIPHLNNPCVLAGFVLFVVAGLSLLFKGLSFGKLSGAATERLLTKLIVGCLILGVLSLVLAFVSEIQKQSRPVPASQTIENVKNSTVSQAGCEAVAAVDSQARVSGGGGELQTINQTINDVEGSTVVQGGCNAAASGQGDTE